MNKNFIKQMLLISMINLVNAKGSDSILDSMIDMMKTKLLGEKPVAVAEKKSFPDYTYDIMPIGERSVVDVASLMNAFADYQAEGVSEENFKTFLQGLIQQSTINTKLKFFYKATLTFLNKMQQSDTQLNTQDKQKLITNFITRYGSAFISAKTIYDQIVYSMILNECFRFSNMKGYFYRKPDSVSPSTSFIIGTVDSVFKFTLSNKNSSNPKMVLTNIDENDELPSINKNLDSKFTLLSGGFRSLTEYVDSMQVPSTWRMIGNYKKEMVEFVSHIEGDQMLFDAFLREVAQYNYENEHFSTNSDDLNLKDYKSSQFMKILDKLLLSTQWNKVANIGFDIMDLMNVYNNKNSTLEDKQKALEKLKERIKPRIHSYETYLHFSFEMPIILWLFNELSQLIDISVSFGLDPSSKNLLSWQLKI